MLATPRGGGYTEGIDPFVGDCAADFLGYSPVFGFVFRRASC